MLSKSPFTVIECPVCGEGEVEVTSKLRWNAIVYCCACGGMLCTWSEFLERVRGSLSAAAGAGILDGAAASRWTGFWTH